MEHQADEFGDVLGRNIPRDHLALVLCTALISELVLSVWNRCLSVS